MRFAFLLMIPFLLPSCDAVPADPEHTLMRVKESGQLRIGIVEGSGSGPTEDFVKTIEDKTGASAAIRRGEAEHLLKKLEDGELDLVIGSFAQKKPVETACLVKQGSGWQRTGSHPACIKGGGTKR